MGRPTPRRAGLFGRFKFYVQVDSSRRDAEGGFWLKVPEGALTLRLSGKNVNPSTRLIAANDATADLRLTVEYVVPPIQSG